MMAVSLLGWPGASSREMHWNSLSGKNLMKRPQINSPEPIRRHHPFYYHDNSAHLVILPPTSTIATCTANVKRVMKMNSQFLKMPENTLNSPNSISLALSWLKSCMNTNI